MSSRYSGRKAITNNFDMYKETFEKRKVNFIRHYRSPTLTHPTPHKFFDLNGQEHIWKLGDKLSKLAHRYYGKPDLWWVIAWFNNLPTDAHIQMGEKVYVPLPLEEALRTMKTL